MTGSEETIVGRRQQGVDVTQPSTKDDSGKVGLTAAEELIDQCLEAVGDGSIMDLPQALLLSTATMCATLLEVEVKFSKSAEAGIEESLKSLIRLFERHPR